MDGDTMSMWLALRPSMRTGYDPGGRRAAALYSLIESAKLNGLNAQHYLTAVLTRIAELLPWKWRPRNATRAAA